MGLMLKMCVWVGRVRWFSLHSKFIFLEGCRVTGRFWPKNVNKTNKKGVYSTILFEGCRVNGFWVATVGRFDWSHLRFGVEVAAPVRGTLLAVVVGALLSSVRERSSRVKVRGVNDDATHEQNDVVTHLLAGSCD
ncbi:hypothetical protein HMPREF0183_2382 [Brevibacterium mcbrellneri ATCC 49030]|uniref:Uncharacterized protein n=1 Tax=Brevibacterium mcbrellneri ATCC 49030 TaxID=585530 RepID=D4YR22_9MICO|nr:hypothetical protein HMPREF0183_2382 [Brevibacterium mcbrellneri ATCC 49030]